MLSVKIKIFYVLLFISSLCLVLPSTTTYAQKDLCTNKYFVRDMLAAGERGVAVAQAGIATCYLNGVGVPQSDAEAAGWYERAAQQGDANSQYLMGWLYDKGKGVKKDDTSALQWYLRAAEQGDSTSQFLVGMAYLDGKGTAVDHLTAAKWLERSAVRGVYNAQSSLAGMYLTGQGVSQDSKEAYFWSILAAASGDKERVGIRNQIKTELTPEEINQIQARARAWQPLPDMTPP